ncbi:hypothetical protein PVAP13_4KG294000 [Panicum virgatum]|uniref:Uncharacterized protein n=1 Tax=Panicum virgatum TaxID=38727 RepID=A0A8T0TRW3_PANVG|nr:hypothetical protein PVAP13_4KG294000 [Panicum virgatum]
MLWSSAIWARPFCHAKGSLWLLTSALSPSRGTARMSSNTRFCLIRLLTVVLSILLVIVSRSVAARSLGPRPSCANPNNRCPGSCSPFSNSCH